MSDDEVKENTHTKSEPPEGGDASGEGSKVEQAKADIEQSKQDQPSDQLAQEVGADQVQEKVDEEQQKGYFGVVADDTPNENYTVQGVTERKPTPEAPLPPVKQE